MAHMYDKAPPKFAKDPWAWDYTRDRIEQNTGIPYDEWVGKHFAGAAAMYKNVVKKYGASIEANNLTLPHECVNCGMLHEHYVDDYVCTICRKEVEAAPDHQTASAIVRSEDSVDAIKEKLYESLGHAAKDRKAGKALAIAEATDYPTFKGVSVSKPVSEPQNAPEGVSRNYAAMGDNKLGRVVRELEAYVMDGTITDSAGWALARVESVEAHYEAALRAAQRKGMAV